MKLSSLIWPLFVSGVLFLLSCGQIPIPPQQDEPTLAPKISLESSGRSSRLALWLAKKDELIAYESAQYDLVMSGWFEPEEADSIRSRDPSTMMLAGLTHTWVLDDPGWINLLYTIANDGDPDGALRITDDMVLGFDDDGDGFLDRRCTLPGWDNIFAIDPRHLEWRKLITAFYANVSTQPQHDGIVIDMVDAFSFCDGAWSMGIPAPINEATWVDAQSELLKLIRESTVPEKMVVANAGRDFPEGSPFPQHLNGYLLENFLGSWGANLETGMASAVRALDTTQPPHTVIFAVDTDDTGVIDWQRFRVGFAASLMLDNTYFAFDFGPRDHGGVSEWWFPDIYNVELGAPLGPYNFTEGLYRREFDQGLVVIATKMDTNLSFETPHRGLFSGESGQHFIIRDGDAGVFVELPH